MPRKGVLVTKVSGDEERLSRVLVGFSLTYCVPIYFGDPSEPNGLINSGTITLVRRNDENYGITNFHVVDGFRDRLRDNPNVHLYVGGQRVELNDVLLDEDKDLDIAVLYLEGFREEVFFTQGDIPTSFYNFPVSSVDDINEGGFVLFGGYPGVWRERDGRNVVFDSFSSGGTLINDASEKNIRCEIAANKSVVTRVRRDSPPTNLGGLSGSPVFIEMEGEAGVRNFVLVGVIYEYIEQYDSILIRPLHCINDDMTIKK